MANYVPSARTNYFKVRDPEAFRTWLAQFSSVEVWEEATVHIGEQKLTDGPYFGLGFEDGLPQQVDDEDITEEEYDFLGELAQHLADGWVAVYEEVGYERLRYVVGFAVAINNKGETRTVNINEIYTRAVELGAHITPAEY